jgi:hypothetical protein
MQEKWGKVVIGHKCAESVQLNVIQEAPVPLSVSRLHLSCKGYFLLLKCQELKWLMALSYILM